MLNHYALIAGYFGICIFLAFLGRNRKWGFWGYFWSSLLLSPLLGFFFLLASDPKPSR